MKIKHKLPLPVKVLTMIFGSGRKFYETDDAKMVMRLRKMTTYGFVREISARGGRKNARFIPTQASKSLLELIDIAVVIKNERDELKAELETLENERTNDEHREERN